MCIRDSTHIETQPNGRSGVASGLRVSDLVFDPTLACSGVRARLRQRKRSPATSSHTSPAPKPTTLTGPRQDLLLNRAMLSVNKTPYVGRFARGWHRLATTEPLAALDLFYAPADLGLRAHQQDEAEAQPEHECGEGRQQPSQSLRRLPLEAQRA